MVSFFKKVFVFTLGNMPRKFRRYVPKGYSRKGFKPRSTEDNTDSVLQADSLQSISTKTMVDFATQTDESVEVHDDIGAITENKAVEVQTDIGGNSGC